MWVVSESGNIIMADCVREFGLMKECGGTYGAYAFGVGDAPGYCNEHRYLVQHTSMEHADAVLGSLKRALAQGKTVFDVKSVPFTGTIKRP